MLRKMRLVCLILFLLGGFSTVAQETPTDSEMPSSEMMKEYLLGQIARHWTKWQSDYEARKTPEAIAEYQGRMYDVFIDAIGGLPARTPLNPQVVGVIERDGYRVEKILFESRPKFYVSAALFLPDPARHRPPYPGVLVPCGHAQSAKAHVEYQSVGALLALNGIAALVYDPIDQGERVQLLNADGKPVAVGTHAHTLLGTACILLGVNTATFEIWDGMRALDYLESRPEVDPQRMGCTGNSGGGTQTSYLMALDPRIKAAAVSCYLHYQAVQLRKSPGDAEQNLFGQLVTGLDHPDFIMMRAPRPVLICAATRDFFDINATWETVRYAKRLYTRIGFAERIDILENDAEHNYDRTQREGVARWMSRWLLHQDAVITEPELKLLDEKELWCTPRGQVMLLDGARSAFDFNIDCENELAAQRDAKWRGGDKRELLDEVRKIAAIRTLDQLPEPEIIAATSERHVENDCKTERLLLRVEPGVTLPALQFTPAQANPEEIVLLVSDKGKDDAARAGGPVESLVKQGKAVLALDVRGLGETHGPTKHDLGDGVGADWEDFFRAFVLGRSYVGMRAEDILTCARLLKKNGFRVHLSALGNTGIAALHAAALEPDLFASVKLSGSLVSWSDAVHRKPARNLLINAVHGALKVYDLPNLAGMLGDKLTVENPLDGQGNSATE